VRASLLLTPFIFHFFQDDPVAKLRADGLVPITESKLKTEHVTLELFTVDTGFFYERWGIDFDF
jgi:hypothetical protein